MTFPSPRCRCLLSVPQEPSHIAQGADDRVRVVFDLGMADAHRAQPSGDHRLISPRVSFLPGGRPVVPQPVRFDDEAELPPKEVHPVRADPHLGFRTGQPGAARQPKKPSLELGLGQDEGRFVKDAAERRHSAQPGPRFDLLAQSLGIDPAEPIRSVHGSFESPLRGLRQRTSGPEVRGKVDECPCRRGDRDPPERPPVPRLEPNSVDPDALGTKVSLSWYRDRREITPPILDAPESRRRRVPQQRPVTTAEHGGHPARLSGQLQLQHRIDGGVQSAEAARPEAMLNPLAREAQLEQLRAGDHPVLPVGQLPGR